MNADHLTCSIAVALVLGLAVPLLSFDLKGRLEKLESQLSTDQQNEMKKIKEDRLKIFMWSLVIGALVGAVSLSMSLPQESYTTKEGLCIFLASGLSALIASYLLWPKSKTQGVMVLAADPTQLQEYLQIERSYQIRFVLGLVVGFVGCMVLCSMSTPKYAY